MYVTWEMVYSPDSISCAALFTLTSLMNSMGASPVRLFSFLKKTDLPMPIFDTSSSTVRSAVVNILFHNPHQVLHQLVIIRLHMRFRGSHLVGPAGL